MNQFDIPESHVEVDPYGANNYIVLTTDEMKRLQEIHKDYKILLSKQKDALSSMIRYIIECTYLYLSYVELNFYEDIQKVLKKDYYKNLDPHFVNMLNDDKPQEFIRELVRTQVLRMFQESQSKIFESYNKSRIKKGDFEATEKMQFRLSKDDKNLIDIIFGNRVFSNPDYLSSLIRYFLSSNTEMILYFPITMKLKDAMENKKYVYIRDRKYKVVDKDPSSLFRGRWLCFDERHKRFVPIGIRGLSNDDIEISIERYNFTKAELAVVEAFKKLNNISVQFRFLASEEEINRLAGESFVISSLFKNSSINEDDTKTYKTNNLHFVDRMLNIYARKGIIEIIDYSQNYKDYKEALEMYES